MVAAATAIGCLVFYLVSTGSPKAGMTCLRARALLNDLPLQSAKIVVVVWQILTQASVVKWRRDRAFNDGELAWN